MLYVVKKESSYIHQSSIPYCTSMDKHPFFIGNYSSFRTIKKSVPPNLFSHTPVSELSCSSAFEKHRFVCLVHILDVAVIFSWSLFYISSPSLYPFATLLYIISIVSGVAGISWFSRGAHSLVSSYLLSLIKALKCACGCGCYFSPLLLEAVLCKCPRSYRTLEKMP